MFTVLGTGQNIWVVFLIPREFNSPRVYAYTDTHTSDLNLSCFADYAFLSFNAALGKIFKSNWLY